MAFHNFIGDREGWKILQDEPLFTSPHIAVHRVQVTTPTRAHPFHWSIAHRKGAVVVAPVTTKGEFLLVRQERVPIRETIWEFPAGQIDDIEEEDHIRSTGLRELREESGYELAPGGELISLGYFFPSAGFTDEHSHLLLARPVVPSPRGTSYDAGEGILGVRAVSPAEFREMIAKGEIRDANTLSAFARMAAMGIV